MTEKSIMFGSGQRWSARDPVVWVGLLLASALAWAITASQVASMGGTHGMASMRPTTAFIVFLPVWIAMMVAMMFPAVAPVVSLFRMMGQNRRAAGSQTVTPTWIFLTGYLMVWTLFGLGAYALSLLVPALDMAAPGLRSISPIVGAFVLIAAGLYQWSPLKSVCLRHCRSPLGVLLQLWRDGLWGGFRMGVIHGAYCFGCCWGLMLVLFTLGLMSIWVMIGVAAVIFAEKVIPHGELISRFTGAALVLLGVAALAGLPAVSSI